MINVREIHKILGLWAYLAVTGCASCDVERSRSATSHVVQRCQQADDKCRFQPGTNSHI
jgi:hypothetical protein